MATKEKVKQGKHLTVTTAADGTVNLKWDWDALLKEVRVASGITPVPKKNLVKETETKVTKARAKKAEEKASPAKTKTATKKAPAKKPAAKKVIKKA